jgi:hypothetical protein
MSPDEFRAWLERHSLTQASFARLMRDLGDPRSPATILRSVSNWCRGVTALPGEMCVVTRLLAERLRNDIVV